MYLVLYGLGLLMLKPSGIGAIEHALDRMQIDHEIVFACDNGEERSLFLGKSL